ncbi:uncharacterized protein LW93_1611 [Fusarium fujikuroi]|nr:uncharacterized protein LW93_1611 [Fusarium fujikuroi]
MLELRRINPCQHDAYNFHALIQPDSKAKLTNFVDIFMQSIAEDAAQQRKRYPEKYEVPDENQVIISDEAAIKIESTVRRWHPEVYWPDDGDDLKTFKQPTTKKLCPHTSDSDNCGCVLPYKERKMSAFQRPQVQNDCFKFDIDNRESFRNLQVVESLILHGEMDAILRSCAYEECQLAKWREHRECECTQVYFGWRSIYEDAIRMYMILNIIQHFPEIREANGSPIEDYRNLAAYQQAVRSSTESGYRSEIAMFPHRDFLGIEKDQFWWNPRPHDVPRWKHIMRFDTNGFENYQKGLDRFGFSCSDDESDAESHNGSSTNSGNKSSAENDSDDGSSDEPEEKDPEEVENMFYTLEFYPLGLMSYDDFLNFEKLMEYRPSPPDISHVRSILFQKGLPIEITDRILERIAQPLLYRTIAIEGRNGAKSIGTLLLKTFVENPQLAEQVRAVSLTDCIKLSEQVEILDRDATKTLVRSAMEKLDVPPALKRMMMRKIAYSDFAALILAYMPHLQVFDCTIGDRTFILPWLLSASPDAGRPLGWLKRDRKVEVSDAEDNDKKQEENDFSDDEYYVAKKEEYDFSDEEEYVVDYAKKVSMEEYQQKGISKGTFANYRFANLIEIRIRAVEYPGAIEGAWTIEPLLLNSKLKILRTFGTACYRTIQRNRGPGEGMIGSLRELKSLRHLGVSKEAFIGEIEPLSRLSEVLPESIETLHLYCGGIWKTQDWVESERELHNQDIYNLLLDGMPNLREISVERCKTSFDSSNHYELYADLDNAATAADEEEDGVSCFSDKDPEGLYKPQFRPEEFMHSKEAEWPPELHVAGWVVDIVEEGLYKIRGRPAYDFRVVILTRKT